MNLLFIVSLLISFILQTYEYYYLAIPARLLIHQNGSHFYYSLNKFYYSRKDLTESVKKRFSKIPLNVLLIHVISLHHGSMMKSSLCNNNFFRVKSDRYFSYSKDITLKNTDFLIETSSFKGKLMYKCNEGYYDSYQKASEYLDNIKKYEKVKSQYRLVGKDAFGRDTWYSVWNGCYYRCFSRRNFFELGIKFLEELNKYRKHFSIDPVKLSTSLHKYACFAAKCIAEGNMKLIHKLIRIFSNEIVIYTSAPFANIQMNKCYEEFLSIKKTPKNNKKRTKLLNALFSRRTTKIGFGVFQKGKDLIIVFMYK